MTDPTPTVPETLREDSGVDGGPSYLRPMPPMGIYETLYAFQDAFGKPMGEPDTHPWSQGYPRTEQIPGGPKMPSTITVSSEDRLYPKSWGLPALRQQIASYY